MKSKILKIICSVVISSLSIIVDSQDISLPAPDKTGGKPLMQVLNERQTIRTFTKDTLTRQQISDLLWAAWGINRADQKKHTAPSSSNRQEIDVYVALPAGLYLYTPETNILKQVNNKDLRKLSGTQDWVADAPVNLIYVADLGKLGKKEGDVITDSNLLSSYANTAFIAQNVYLYCTSANLGSVVRGLVPRDQLSAEMGLRSNQRIILAHTVGVPQGSK